ncbi:MAG TPA: LacI family DNA-binding transcriptional regulator [Galbitalea sp.]|jgi:DNA-binding LacI/PurR family transcriptional regulator|nr:LacI family DNA-binding transcriptional regulator [Galbitalea sp.]
MTTKSERVSGPNMREVGLLAGVSHQTVFRVMQGHPKVAQATRDRVMAAVEQLGYTPNLSARSLVTGRSHMLGLITVGSQDTGPISSTSGFAEGFTSRARLRSYYVSATHVTDTDPQGLRTSLGYFLQQRFEGVVVLTPTIDVLNALKAARPALPFVTLGGGAVFPDNSVSLDQTRGAILATQHLIDLGHRRIGHISGPLRRFDAMERLGGWRETMRENNLDASRVWEGDWSARGGSVLAAELFDSGATAVFCANDQTALGVMHAAKLKGIRVPKDLSIVGFDDMPEAPYFPTPLTTVRQDYERLGEDSVELLLAQVEESYQGTEVLVEPTLVFRESTMLLSTRD